MTGTVQAAATHGGMIDCCGAPAPTRSTKIKAGLPVGDHEFMCQMGMLRGRILVKAAS